MIDKQDLDLCDCTVNWEAVKYGVTLCKCSYNELSPVSVIRLWPLRRGKWHLAVETCRCSYVSDKIFYFSFAHLYKLTTVKVGFTLRSAHSRSLPSLTIEILFVGYLPNGIHAVEAMLATASIGAIWSSTSPDFGINVSNLSIAHSREVIIMSLPSADGG